ncbi:c-type cytochrome [Enterovibrio paralichthyis]|uniref:c-type cytochrome n=1 Tax=Enterovibrio paralichthyis TaxID=2853805 RepID=UPI001C469C24|nr:c-type cytochrome [Enterovibrio paralichthyis]MBV7300404.1 cytochrome c4 [Enterovibrio paralichthyis]
MKRLALLLTLFASFTAFAQGDAEAGKAKSATCAACHGADGNSVIPANPVLAGQHEKYLLKQLQEFKLGATTGGEQGRYNAVMAGMVAPLNEQDMADLAAYFASQTAKPGSTPESSIDIGEELYMAGNKDRGIAACVACHGPRGNGTPLSGFPKISGQHADYIKAQLMAFRDGQRNNDLNGMMRIVASKMSDKEIDAISKYVGGLH